MLTKYEQETIINFNKEDKMASVFTYEKTWQNHLEKKLGLKPTLDNGFGGKGYEIDKKRIKMPRASRLISAKRRKQLSDNLAKSNLGRKSANTIGKSRKESNG